MNTDDDSKTELKKLEYKEVRKFLYLPLKIDNIEFVKYFLYN